MGINKSFDEIGADSIETDTLTDAGDGEDWETLREIGYQKGDSKPVFQIPFALPSPFTTSGSSWGTDNSAAGHVALTTTGLPDDATVRGRMAFGTGGNQDTTGEYQIRFTPKGELDGSTVYSPIETSSTTYSYHTTDAVEIPLRGAHEADFHLRSDGTNTVSLWAATAVIEVIV